MADPLLGDRRMSLRLQGMGLLVFDRRGQWHGAASVIRDRPERLELGMHVIRDCFGRAVPCGLCV